MSNFSNLRIAVRGVYDLQGLRIQKGNRIVANFKARMGQVAAISEDELTEENQTLLAKLREDYDKLTDGVKTFPRPNQFVGSELISTYTELVLLRQYIDMEKSEEEQFKMIQYILSEEPVYTRWLKNVTGIGPAIAGVILSEIDFAKCRYPSSLWKYAGYDVGLDGMGRSRRAEHLQTYKYMNKAGVEAERQGISFNPLLKTKLFLAGCSFIKCGAKSPYTKVYYDTKARLEQHPTYGVANDGKRDANNKLITCKARRHMMAMRKMIKIFLIDLHVAARTILGLEVSVPYHEAKLGIVHSGPATTIPIEPVKPARVRRPKAKKK